MHIIIKTLDLRVAAHHKARFISLNSAIFWVFLVYTHRLLVVFLPFGNVLRDTRSQVSCRKRSVISLCIDSHQRSLSGDVDASSNPFGIGFLARSARHTRTKLCDTLWKMWWTWRQEILVSASTLRLLHYTARCKGLTPPPVLHWQARKGQRCHRSKYSNEKNKDQTHYSGLSCQDIGKMWQSHQEN